MLTVSARASSDDDGAVVSLQANVGGGTPPYAYLWSAPGLVLATPTVPIFSVRLPSPGRYTATLSVQDSAGAQASDSTVLGTWADRSAWPNEVMNAQLAADAAAVLADWGEPVIYNVAANAPSGSPAFTPLQIFAVVNRDPPAVVTEDTKVLTDYVEVTLANDPVRGVSAVQKGRDTITVSGRYGGVATAHTVLAIVSGDAGLWTLRVR